MQGFPQVMSLLVNTQASSHVAQALKTGLAVTMSLWSETLRRAKAVAAVRLLLLSEAWP